MKSAKRGNWGQLAAWLALGLILLLGTALALYRLDARSLWSDEITTARIVVQPPDAIVEALKHVHNAPPLYYFAAHAFTYLGTSEFFLRLPSVLFGALALCAAYLLGTLFFDRLVGLIAALLLALAPFHLAYAQEARMYTLFAALALLSLYFFQRAFESDKPRFWVGYTLVTATSLYIHYMTVMYVAVQGAFLACVTLGRWLRRRRDPDAPWTGWKPWLGFVLSGGAILLLYLPWLPVALARSQGSGFLVSQTLIEILTTLTGDYGGPMFALVSAFFVVGIVVGFANQWERRLLLLLWVVLPLPLVLLFLFRADSFFAARYVIYVTPVVLMVAASGLVMTVRWLAGRAAELKGPRVSAFVTAVLLLGLASVLAASTVSALPDYYATPKEDWRGVGRFLQDHVAPGDLVILDGFHYIYQDEGRTSLSLAYYFDAEALGVGYLGVRSLSRAWLEPNTSPRVWGVVYHQRRLEELQAIGERNLPRHDFQHMSVFDASAIDDPLEATKLLLEDMLEWQQGLGARFDVYVALAKVSAWQGRDQWASRYLDKATSLHPGRDTAQQSLGDGWLALASALVERNDYDQALPVAQTALEYTPNSPLAHRLVGDCYRARGMWQEAELAYEQALALSPGLGDKDWFLSRLGQVYAHTGKAAEAEQALGPANGIGGQEGSEPTDWKAVGDAAFDDGRWEEAIAAFQRTVELEPDNDRLWFRLCRTYHRLPGYEGEVLDACRQAADLAPSDAWNRVLLGDAYVTNQLAGEALAEYGAAISLEPGYENEAWYHVRLGDAYRLLGQLEEARRAYRQGLDIDPDHRQARERLSELEP